MRAGMVGLEALYWPIALGKGLAAHPGVDFRAAATLGVDAAAIRNVLGVSPEDYAARFRLTLYRDAREMIRQEELDTVAIVTRHSEHANWVEQLAPLGVNIFIPKTFTTTLADAARIVVTQQRYGVRIAVGPSARFLPPFMAVKQIVAAGRIGRPFALRLCHHHGTIDVFHAQDWYRDPAEGGPELSLGWYGIDLILHLMEDDVRSVFADYGNFTSRHSPFMDCGRMVLHLARGGSAAFDMYFCNRFAYPSWQLELVGPQGVVSIHRRGEGGTHTTMSLDTSTDVQTITPPEPTPNWETFWIDEFLQGSPSSLPPVQAQRITEIALAARQSAQTGQVVAVT